MDVGELQRQVEYKWAPAPLLAVQALANTFAFDDDEERLLDPERARAWLIESDLATGRVRVGEREWRKLVEFRTVVRDLIDANLDGDPRAAASELRELAGEHAVTVAVGETGELTVDLEPVDAVDALLSQMIGIILAAQLEDSWRRLKICASDECRWAFYDGSRNRGGTWCSMETCGNVVKNRAYRERLRQR
jgi:predicted RNA-binding Zn ribbon-like protein